MFHKLLKALFPDRCVLCGHIVHSGAICNACRDNISLCRDMRVCKKCSRPLPDEQLLCGNCLVTPRYFTACFSAAIYEKELRHSIILYKFYNHPEYHRGYAKLILSHLSSFDALPRFNVVIGAPLSATRKKERGYNQAELIAKELARLMRLPFCKGCVQKIRHTTAQSDLPYSKRLKNLRGAFRVEKTAEIYDKTILLVDDVLTTGATADEISKQLLKAGAKQVYVATVATTPLK